MHLGGVGPCTAAKAAFGGAGVELAAACWLKALTDGASNKAAHASWVSRAVLIAAISRIADSESPPRSKNESSTPTRSSPSTWA